MPRCAFAPGNRPTRGCVDEGRTVAFGFAPPTNVSQPASADSAARLSRMLEPAEWASAGIPLLRNPREVVAALYERHLPGSSTAVVAVLDPQERLTASASFSEPSAAPDGWQFRNLLLAHLRRVIPHDLRLRAPIRTAVLLYCREGDPRWTEADGAWMWGLRDACTLHGLRCGAYITLTRDRWQVLGEDRGGRRPKPSPTAFPPLTAPGVETRNGPRAQRRAERRAETRRGEARRAGPRRDESPGEVLGRNESPRTASRPHGSWAQGNSPHGISHADGTDRNDRAESAACGVCGTRPDGAHRLSQHGRAERGLAALCSEARGLTTPPGGAARPVGAARSRCSQRRVRAQWSHGERGGRWTACGSGSLLAASGRTPGGRQPSRATARRRRWGKRGGTRRPAEAGGEPSDSRQSAARCRAGSTRKACQRPHDQTILASCTDHWNGPLGIPTSAHLTPGQPGPRSTRTQGIDADPLEHEPADVRAPARIAAHTSADTPTSPAGPGADGLPGVVDGQAFAPRTALIRCGSPQTINSAPARASAAGRALAVTSSVPPLTATITTGRPAMRSAVASA